MDKNIELIKEVYSAISRGDIESALARFAPDAFRNEFEGETYKGLAELKKNFLAGRSTWAEGACVPVEFHKNREKYMVKAHVKVRLKNEPNWIDAFVMDGFSIRDGLFTEFHSFTSKEKAFAWAESGPVNGPG